MKADAATREKLAEIGQRLRTARLAAGISQSKLAELIGMARENYVRLESGRVNATIETLLRAATGAGADLKIVFEPKKKPSKRTKSSATTSKRVSRSKPHRRDRRS
ncbi:MAG TPA: helix-turn-helix transcriptional regulator [Polyangiaceae bacterium]